MNTIDICPVGALTSRDFRFKARVWEMSATESVCPGCSRGCNTFVWVRNNEILRLTPRFNADVNEYWMCDNGRLNSFRHVNAETRLKSPQMRKDQELAEVGWDESVAKAASELKPFRKSEVAVIGSPYATNEDNYVLQKFAHDILGTRLMAFRTHEIPGDQDDLLIRADKTPNSRGTAALGIPGGAAFEGILRGIREGQIKALYVVEDNVAADPATAQVLSRLELLVVHSSNENETTRMADIVFPCSTFAERNGTYANFQGRVQRIRPAVATLDSERSMDGFAMSRLDRFGTQFDRWGRGARRDARPTWRIISGIASLMGNRFRYATAEEVFADLASTIGAFKGMSYLRLGKKGMALKADVAAGIHA